MNPLQEIISRSKEKENDQKGYCKYSGFDPVLKQPPSYEIEYGCQQKVIQQVFGKKWNWNQSEVIIIGMKNEENRKENNVPGEGDKFFHWCNKQRFFNLMKLQLLQEQK